MALTAVFFDFDGTLLDTESVAMQTWAEEYAHHRIAFDEDRWIDGLGSDTDYYAALAQAVGGGFDLPGSRQRRRGREDSLVAALQPAAGIDEALLALGDLGVRLAVVSSSPARWVTPHLDRLGWLGRFETVVTRDDAHRAKPHPDLYLVALERLGLPPGGCVAVEDSANGVRAAVAAGIRCVAMPNAVTARQDLSHAHARCAPAQLLAELLRERPPA